MTVIGVTSMKGGVGKSVVASLLASSAARLGRSTVLFDLDPSNPDQLSRQRERMLQVPGRMPTLLDDSFPSQWWSDPESGVQLVPGPRSGRDRREGEIVVAAVRGVERSREARDVTLLDLHQVARNRYTVALVGLCDVVVSVVDHDPQSREHLREWLDHATDRHDDEFLPVLDHNQVRLVYSEGVALGGRESEAARLAAQADMGQRYVWAGRFSFDAGIVDGGAGGDLLSAVSEATQRSALGLAGSVLGVNVPLFSPPRRSWCFWRRRPVLSPFEAVKAVKAEGLVRERPVGPSSPVAGLVEVPVERAKTRLTVCGKPSLTVAGETMDVDAAGLALVVLTALHGPMSVESAASWLGLSIGDLERIAAEIPDGVDVSSGLVARPAELVVDVLQIRAASDDLIQGTSGSLVAAVKLLRGIDGHVLDVDVGSDVWGWVDRSYDGPPSTLDVVVREVENFVARIADHFVAAAPVDMIVGAELVRLIVNVGVGLARVVDPTPVAVAAAAVARVVDDLEVRQATSAAVSRLEITNRHWEVLDELAALLNPQLVRSFSTSEVIANPGNTSMLFDSAGEVRPTPVNTVVADESTSGAGDFRPLVGGSDRPLVLLLTMSGAVVEGANVSHLLPVPFAVASAGRALSDGEVAAVTGYSQKSVSTTFTLDDSSVVVRRSGSLGLAEGVWLDHRWMVECVSRAQRAVSSGEMTVAQRWTAEVLNMMTTLEGAPYSVLPGRSKYWDWVDEFPDMSASARQEAERDVVDAVIAATDLWSVCGLGDLIDRGVLIGELCRISQLIPDTLVGCSTLSGDALIRTAVGCADGDRGLIGQIADTARRMIAAGQLDPSDELVDLIGV